MTIEGLNTLLIMPDFGTPPKMAGTILTDDAGISEARGISAYVSPRPLHSFSLNFKFFSRAAAAALEDFLDGQGGKWKQFFVPSWHGELNPVATLANGSNSLQISPVNYATVFNPTNANMATLGHYIFCVHYDGTFFISKVNSVSGTTTETLTLATAAPKDFPKGQFFVGFMYCVNALSDDVILTFTGPNIIEATLGVTEALEITDGNGS